MKNLRSLLYLATFVVTLALARSVPLKPRSYGNFGPAIPKTFVTFSDPEPPLAGTTTDLIQSAVNFYSQRFGHNQSTIKISASHRSTHNGVTHIYVQQVLNGLHVVNGVGNINVDVNGGILSIGNSFYNGVVPSTDQLSAYSKVSVEAITASLSEFLNHAQLAPIETPPTLRYIQDGFGVLRLVYDVRADTQDNMYNAFMDVETSEVIELVDWVSDASYNVYPLGINDPSSGERAVVVDPANFEASPLGWHSQAEGVNTTTTIGNNVVAQENFDGTSDYLDNQRPEGTAALRFDFPINLAQEPPTYIEAATTNLFFWNNIIHDLYYVYGFDEEAGNFQENNFGRGGLGQDSVIAHAQDGSGVNNANFATPPDGNKGRMRMYVWNNTSPRRDGDLDSGIIIHEYSHGLSTRLTGGPLNVGCLRDGEAGGMGEGWGDIIATVLRTTENTTRAQNYAMGDYSAGSSGIRKNIYSTNMTTNPSLYSFTIRDDYPTVHNKGEVWAVTLYEVYWNLVEKHGFDPNWFNVSPATGNSQLDTYISLVDGKTRQRSKNEVLALGGNVIFIQLLIDGMKIQPCSPNFIDARNSILQADAINNGGENGCELWRGFAKRGLGVSARSPGVDGFDVPAACA